MQGIDKYKNILNLENWDIQVLEVDTLEVDAMCKMIYNDYKAVIQIKNEFNDDLKEQALIHELLHLIHRDSHDISSEYIINKGLNDMYVRNHERAIEQMAKIIYKLTRENSKKAV